MATDRTAARKRARPAPVEPQAPDLDVLEDACCPITLEVFRDPVTLAQSGITYERAALEDALARQPGVDPETNKEFDGAPTIVANHTLRRLIASLSAKRDKEDDAAATNEDAAHRRPPKSPAAADEAEAPAPKKRGRKKDRKPAAAAEPAKKPAAPPKKRGRPRKVVEGASAAELGASAAASSLAAEIEAAIAKKPKLAAESIAMVLHKSKQVDGLCAAGITTVGGLALASVDEEKNLRAVSKAQRLSDARPVFWNLKSAAAKRLEVAIGALPRAPYGSCARP